MGKMITLGCTDCGHEVERKQVDPYTGHWYDNKCTYVCEECRGTMRDITHLEGSICACDMVLKDIEHIHNGNIYPGKVWLYRGGHSNG